MINITNVTNIQSLGDMGQSANSYTGGLFWGIILIAFFFIYIFRTMENGLDKSLAVGSFVCLMLSLSLLVVGWVAPLFPIIFSIILAGTLFYLKFKQT